MLDAVKLHEELGVYVAQYSGHVDPSDIRGAYTAMVANPSFRPGMRAICDLRSAELDLSGEDMRVLAALVRAVAPRWGRTKWLALVASDVAYGLLRMFISLTDSCSISTMVVRDPSEAGDWLELGIGTESVLGNLDEAGVVGPSPAAIG
jgi:hypothetical protein